MRTSKWFLILTAVMLCLSFSSALAESPLTDVWDSGAALLFGTDNVTLDGEAMFDLGGEWFKTANLHYVQAGYDSYYELKLISPKKDGSTREGGWIIVGNEKPEYESTQVYLIEAFTPGEYRMGLDGLNDTVLRRSVELDALMSLGRSMAAYLEPTLPEGAVTVEEEDGGVKAVRVILSGDQIPDMAQNALNLAAGFLADRWFLSEYDRSYTYIGGPFEDYIAPASALAYGTLTWTLKSVDVTFSLDAEGRLTAVNGSASVESTFWDKSVRTVDMRFSLTATDFGASEVAPFSPDDYGVSLPEYDW